MGADAGQILHNLTTNDVQSLSAGQSLETFITEVRGKVLQHALAIRTADGFRLVGPPGEEAADTDADAISYSERLVHHCDRYTIREDATPTIRDKDFVAFVAEPGVAVDDLDLPISSSDWHRVNWLGANSHVALVPADEAASISGNLLQDEAAFHSCRVLAGYPWYGVDFNEKNLPQEADRDSVAINFNKGCYLGQETIARLDALGQVQKKIVRWKLHGEVSAGDALTSQDKTVGRVTSLAPSGDSPTEFVALGMTRRSHFDAGSKALGKAGLPNQYEAEVITGDV